MVCSFLNRTKQTQIELNSFVPYIVYSPACPCVSIKLPNNLMSVLPCDLNLLSRPRWNKLSFNRQYLALHVLPVLHIVYTSYLGMESFSSTWTSRSMHWHFMKILSLISKFKSNIYRIHAHLPKLKTQHSRIPKLRTSIHRLRACLSIL